MNRATFVQQLQMGTAGILFSPYALFQDQPELLDALLGKVGLQLFSVPGLLGENFDTGAALLHELGFSSLETLAPTVSAVKQQNVLLKVWLIAWAGSRVDYTVWTLTHSKLRLIH